MNCEASSRQPTCCDRPRMLSDCFAHSVEQPPGSCVRSRSKNFAPISDSTWSEKRWRTNARRFFTLNFAKIFDIGCKPTEKQPCGRSTSSKRFCAIHLKESENPSHLSISPEV